MDNHIKSAISKLYGGDEDFIVLGLTGQTGSGCTTLANILKSEKREVKHSLFSGNNYENNEERKDKIIAKHFDACWEPFCVIQASSVLTFLLAEEKVDKSIKYIKKFIKKIDDRLSPENEKELKKILKDIKREKGPKNRIFYCKTLIKYHQKIKDLFEINIYVNLYQEFGTNARKSGSCIKKENHEGMFFTLAEKINSIIKDIKKEGGKTFIVIDSIRNPLEAIFFQERYAAFFLVAVTCADSDRKDRLIKLNFTEKSIHELDEKEYKNRKINDTEAFYTQDIKTCLQKADIYINNPKENNEISKFMIMANQIIRFVSLMKRPGLVTPTSIERCMQIAFTAKLNSGCISRQVGAVITNENYSIKGVGWNDTPQGQVPCNLRNRFDLVNGKDQAAYSTYEKSNKEYIDWFSNRSKQYENIDSEGRNISFCFKSEYNTFENKNDQGSCKCKDNQVHTRSLHAEENAFLQIVKYGGSGIQDGLLFTTASPCELCAKKAYQLDIKKIYYIDPYPGIAQSHILEGGQNNPKLILFSGAIGRAYNRLYSPIVPYKDELESFVRTPISSEQRA